MDELVKRDCRFFHGDLPCRPHKDAGVHCGDCRFYDPMTGRVLIIKLGAIGDVIRTTPLLRRLRETNPGVEIWWLTRSPEILPDLVDRKLAFSLESVLLIEETPFDVVYSLDKDREACALACRVRATLKKGLLLQDGKCAPADKDAEHKILTGLFDDVSRRNIKSYQQEIFEMCGFVFAGEKYVLAPPGGRWPRRDPRSSPTVGLNTGCGARWPSRLWPESSWVELARGLLQRDFAVLLLGGPPEHQRNLRIARESGAEYRGHFALPQFMALVNECDLVVTGVTMAMHLAIGFEKKIVVLNNIFNKNEFELYGLGEVLEPSVACTCYYSPTCEKNCMQYLAARTVLEATERLLAEKV